MKNAITIIILTIICNLVENGYTQNNKCSIGKFQCKNGQCIESDLLCDGRADCKDKSDETFSECSKPEITCPDYAFRCSYGACVDGDATCNGVKDCVDNSDETLSKCINTLHNVSTSCAKNQFKCNNGQCIAQTGLCDGTADCTDNSDETFIQCGSVICPQFSFRCNYGACIDGDLKCNGVTNCVDGSDEDPKICRNIETVTPEIPIFPTPTKPVTTRPTSSYKSCIVPPLPENGYRKLHKALCCIGRNTQSCDHCDVEQGRLLEPGASLVYSCNSGYKLNDSSDVYCNSRGEWSEIPVCIEIRCEALQSISRNAECKYNDEQVSCFSDVLPQTVAFLQCRLGYRPDSQIFSRSVRCSKTGQWDPKPMQCIPECGVPASSFTPLIVNSTQANITEFPWHATLYRAENDNAPKQFLCGATIIHENLLVTAAHCVFDESQNRIDEPSKYYIATGNIFRDYDSNLHNPKLVQKARVKNIYHICNYIGLAGNYAGDIALLEIRKPFRISSLLVPICLETVLDITQLEIGDLGKVAGFGRTASGPSSFILQSITVPFISFNQCKSLGDTSGKIPLLTSDKFCAGYLNGSSVCDGDSGGGLVFKKGDLWYLKGIVSASLGTSALGGSRTCNSYSYSLYTKVSTYISWIQDIILKLEAQKPISSCSVF